MRRRSTELSVSDGACARFAPSGAAFRSAEPATIRCLRSCGGTSPSPRHRRLIGLYPKLRPARVTVTTSRGKFVRQADEALGSRIVPLDDAGLEAKFIELVGPVLGDTRAASLARQLWDIETVGDIRSLVEATAPQ